MSGPCLTSLQFVGGALDLPYVVSQVPSFLSTAGREMAGKISVFRRRGLLFVPLRDARRTTRLYAYLAQYGSTVRYLRNVSWRYPYEVSYGYGFNGRHFSNCPSPPSKLPLIEFFRNRQRNGNFPW
ncbi:hypothetical protein N656DRAFT_194771 [Canariomyces notabilis]|uniref:Uncharacterized protein n=1 Tax=Canariomyces notabilis TaxID=2074819 RepID=A0AAN6QQK1_9PEZI|nr:hypothetical protein N656DRAFT_194771 [Canariomyces arenarius]